MYAIKQFGGTSVGAGTYLTLTPIEELSVGPDTTVSSIVAIPSGGVYDPLGTSQHPEQLPRVFEVPIFLSATTAALLETAVDTINSWAGKHDKLWIQNAGATLARWRYAIIDVDLRLTSPAQTSITGRCTFTCATPGWSGADLTTGDIPLDTNPHNVAATNGGNRAVDNAVIVLTAGANDITAVTFTVTGVTSITWTGTLAGTKVLSIDCGARSVTNDGADARSTLGLNAAHTISPWLRLAASAVTTMIVTWTGGGLPYGRINGYDGWK
jgi:hypothetical protein